MSLLDWLLVGIIAIGLYLVAAIWIYYFAILKRREYRETKAYYENELKPAYEALRAEAAKYGIRPQPPATKEG